MRIEVHFGSVALTASDLGGRVVLVIDVLRASTTIAVALHNGARAIIPFETAEEAITRSKGFERREVRLAGERRMLPIAGFDLGNSPSEHTREAVEGKTILFTTTNGTAALAAVNAGAARDVVIGAYANYSATLAMLRAAARAGADISILCAGRDRHFSLEDAACAGRYVRGISRRGIRPELDDGATAAVLLDKRFGADIPGLFAESEHGRALAAAGFADDLAVCAAIDTCPVVPVYRDRQITRLGTGRER